MKLAVVDLEPTLGPELVAIFDYIASSPRSRSTNLRVFWDWRRCACRYLRRKLPQFWIYRGGSHIAIHASPPRPINLDRLGQPKPGHHEAGRCLARIVEVRTPSEKREAHQNRVAGQCALPVA